MPPAQRPRVVQLATLPDETAYLDTDDGQWYAVKDGDSDEWRNIRALGIYTNDGMTGRACDVPTLSGPFSHDH